MADFNQNVKINVDLEAKTGSALAEVGSALTQIKASANSLGDELDQIEKDVKSFGESFGKDDDIQIGGEVDLDSIQDAVTSAKLVANRFTSEIGPSNVKIGADVDFSAEEAVNELAEEVSIMEEAVDTGEVWSETKEEVADKNAMMAESADNSVTELDAEASSFDKLIDSGDSLTSIKQSVADANEHVAAMSKESADEILGEDTEARRLGESMGIVQESVDEAGDTMGATTRQLRKMRNSTDKATDSMRAAAEVGDLFEDGLGSLSVNMGAFTVALRNFLTQVPLLLTALGAAGSAALGAASGFVALAGALGAVVAAGAIGHAQQLKSQYSELKTLGDSLDVIMKNLRDTFMEAMAPLLNNEATIDLFVKTVTGLARAVNVVAKAIAGLTEGTAEFNERVEAGAKPLYTVQQAMSDIASKMGPAFRNLVGSLTVAFEVLGEKIVEGSANAVNGLANMIEFSVWLADQIEDLGGLVDQFGQSLRELSILGARIGGGLIPVFEAFSSVMETVASALNKVESQTMQDAITFLVMMAAINRVSGVLGSMLTILPNVIVGMANISSAATSASGAIATMRAATAAAGTQLGGFLAQTTMLGGMTSLVASLTGTSERMRTVAFNTAAASEAFEDMAEDTDHAADELRELAIEGMLTKEVLEDLDDTELDLDVSDGQLDAQQFLPDDSITRTMFGGIGEAADEAGEEAGGALRDSMGRLNFGGQMRSGSDSPFKMFADDADAIDAVKAKMGGLRKSLRSVRKAAWNAVTSFGSFLKQLVMVQLRAIKTAAVMAGSFVKSMLMAGAAALKTAARMAYLTAVTYMQTGSVTTAIAALWNMVTAQNASGLAAIRGAAAKAAGAAANFLLAAASYVASSGMLALAASIAVATGGISILLALIGGLAVGIIANFGAIKSAAGDTFGFLKDVIDVVVDALITYFLASWNLMVEAFMAVKAGLSPLIGMFVMLGKTLGLVGGSAKDGAGGMSFLDTVISVIATSFDVLVAVMSAIIDIMGGVLAIVSTLIRIALTPMLIAIQLIIAALGLLSDWWDFILEDILGVQGGVSGLIDMFMDLFDTFMKGINAIPGAVETIVNAVIGLINQFLSLVNAIPGVNVGTIDEVSFTGESKLKANREELAEGTRQMKEGTAEKGDKTITYNEDNSTNIDQTVNADPEDQAQLSRVVSDAIAEANSFERRRQGGQ